MQAWRASALIVFLNGEQGRKSRILLILTERKEGDLVVTGQMAERDLTVHECLRALAVENKVQMKQT